jgi:aminopeptidase N
VLALNSKVDIFPEQRQVRLRGSYRLVNPHAVPIEVLHVEIPRGLITHSLEFGAHTVELEDPIHGVTRYRLATPLAPAAELAFNFDLEWAPRGFGNTTGPTQVVENGTFFNNGVLPSFGFNEDRRIMDRNERRKRDLGEVPRMAKIDDEPARANTYLSDDADWIDFETTVSTAEDQIALAPGYLQREWVENGRRYFHYTMDVPMLPFAAWLSARWQVKRGDWNGIPIEVYYHPTHDFNVDRMIEAAQKSFDYYNAHFTPYQHKQLRIIEFPGYQRFAQAFANTVPYSEAIGFIADLRDQDDIDYVFYVTAHEVAHQWWAHQVIGANVQGSTMLSESLSQYSALMVMEKEYGRHQMRRFLKYELDQYLQSRATELIEELPLALVENQQYIHYRKGSLVFYALKEAIGEDTLNAILKRFLQDKGYQQPPYTTSRELLAYLREGTDPKHHRLIEDLFEKIVFFDNRVKEATAVKRDDGKYVVTLALHSSKLEAAGKGEETEVALDDEIEIGIFARPDGGKEKDETVLYLQRHRITEKETTLEIVVDGEPFDAGIDPYNMLIDRVSTDNRRQVSLP